MLKNYQIAINDQVKQFARLASEIGAQDAYETITKKRYQAFLGDTPIVCVQSGTGSGKTLMAINAISGISEEYFLDTPRIVLFLVPSDTLKQQTINDLQDPEHIHHRLLKETFGESIVGDLSSLESIHQSTLMACVHVIVTTVQSLNTQKPEGRRAYHQREGHLSIVQTIASCQPLVIIDEAHLNRTELFNNVLANLNPGFVIEWTATPRDNNELIRTPLNALKDEHMVKFPLFVQVNGDGPEGSLTECVQKRAHLEVLARQQSRQLRPIALISADTKNGKFNVEKVVELLTTEHQIPRAQIAIATGEQDELLNINLQHPDCQIRFVVTVQKLREGWNCPWAYCYCSMRDIGSETAKEQFIGRVCRLPDCTPFELEDLNQSYVFSHSDNFDSVVQAVLDGLRKCGFTKDEVSTIIRTPLMPPLAVQTRLELPTDILINIDIEGFNIKQENNQSILEIAPNLPYHELVAGLKQITEQAPLEHREFFYTIAQEERRKRFNPHSPSEQGETFPAIPQIYLGNELVIKTTLSKKLKWDEINVPDNFQFDTIANSRATLIDPISCEVIMEIPANLPALHPEVLKTQSNPKNLIGIMTQQVFKRLRNVAGELSINRVSQWVRTIIDDLVVKGSDYIIAILGKRNALAKAISDRILKIRDERLEKIFVGNLDYFHIQGAPYEISDATQYRPPRSESTTFSKHFFPVVGAMNVEEARWANKLNADPQVKYWIRNLEIVHRATGASGCAFFLPLPNGRFFPDFVVLLQDGTLRLDEYKGEGWVTNDDTKAKKRSGELWATLTGGQFKLVEEPDL